MVKARVDRGGSFDRLWAMHGPEALRIDRPVCAAETGNDSPWRTPEAVGR